MPLCSKWLQKEGNLHSCQQPGCSAMPLCPPLLFRFLLSDALLGAQASYQTATAGLRHFPWNRNLGACVPASYLQGGWMVGKLSCPLQASALLQAVRRKPMASSSSFLVSPTLVLQATLQAPLVAHRWDYAQGFLRIAPHRMASLRDAPQVPQVMCASAPSQATLQRPKAFRSYASLRDAEDVPQASVQAA